MHLSAAALPATAQTAPPPRSSDCSITALVAGMAATKESLIPARFMASAAHFVGTCMVYYAMVNCRSPRALPERWRAECGCRCAQDDNVDASIAASGAGRAKAEASLLVRRCLVCWLRRALNCPALQVAWSIALLCHAVDFVGIFAGFTLFFTRVRCTRGRAARSAQALSTRRAQVNFIQTLCHTVGAVLVFLFVFSAWHYLAFWSVLRSCACRAWA